MHITHIYIYIKPFIWKKTDFHIFRIPPTPNLGTELKRQANQFKTKHLVTLSHASAWGQVWAFDILRNKSSGVVTAVRFEGCFGSLPSQTSLPVLQASFENAVAFHLVSARISSMFCFWNFLRESAVSPPGQLPSPACAEQSCRYEVSSEWSPSPLLPSQKLDWLGSLREPQGHSPLRFCSGLNWWKVGEVGK